MADFLTDKPAKLERAFLVGVQTDKMDTGEAAELLSELKELVENLRITVTRSELVNLRRPTPSLLLGSGKAEELVALAKADNADVIVFDEALSPASSATGRRLSGLAVIDRQEVILGNLRRPCPHPRSDPPGSARPDGILAAAAHARMDALVASARQGRDGRRR
jgi:GTPases